MVSEYEYCASSDIEGTSGIDYSKYGITDSVIDSNISQSERDINIKCNTSFSGTIPDAIKFCAIELTSRRLLNIIESKKAKTISQNQRPDLFNVWSDELLKSIQQYVKEDIKANETVWSY